MKDIVIGSVANYKWGQIKHWCNSLDRSGFTGERMLVVYNGDSELISELEKRGYIVIIGDNNPDMKRFTERSHEVLTLRFRHKWTFLNQMDFSKYRYIISTDVRDLVFQDNPSMWVEQNIFSKRLLVVDEGLPFGQLRWAPDMMRQSFGNYFCDYVSDCMSYNAGVIAGEARTLCDLLAQIYLTSFSAQFRQYSHHGVEQMAFNLLLTLEPWKSITRFTSCKDPWVTNLALQAGENNRRAVDLIRCVPQERNGIIYHPTSDKPYTIVHQFDRVPGWETLLKSKYS